MAQLALRLLPPVASPKREDHRLEVAPDPRPVRPEPCSDPRRSATLARLRALVGERGRVGVLPPVEDPDLGLAHGAISTGTAALDRWLRGWPVPGPTEIVEIGRAHV
mgnify:FL=1